MAKITVMPQGIKGAVASSGNPSPPKRGNVGGWSLGASRRNASFLMSIDRKAINCDMAFLTLTLRDIPATSKEWQRLVKTHCDWIMERGCSYLHWVVEWQKRGAPHLHMVVAFDHKLPVKVAVGLTGNWLRLTEPYGSLPRSQRCDPINDIQAQMFVYVAKHSSRTAAHYQRQAHTMPPGWENTGKMWGKRGNWPVSESTFETDKIGWVRLRRMLRSYGKSEARKRLARSKNSNAQSHKIKSDIKRLVAARTCLKRNTRNVAEVTPISMWAPQETTLRMVQAVQAWPTPG